MLWPLLVTLALLKLLAASMMLWLPFRSDSAVVAVDDPPRSDQGSDEDGGSKVSTDEPSDPHPRRPPRRPRSRGPHGSPSPRSPKRVRVRADVLRSRSQRLKVG